MWKKRNEEVKKDIMPGWSQQKLGEEGKDDRRKVHLKVGKIEE